MCGFIGFTGMLENREAIINKMNERIIHRGPDSGGVFFGEDITLGFRRLSIIDLSDSASQPMISDDGNIAVVFNGEIYNFMTLRDELCLLGHTFRTHGDTETLIHGYEQWGEELVTRLRGMFAFVIYDKKQRKLYGARDYFGIKPFYYTETKRGDILFGSEIKCFLEHPDFVPEVNADALKPYLTLQYSSMPETFWRGVYKLPAAHYFSYENGKMKTVRYWDIDFDSARVYPDSLDKCAEQIDIIVHESVAAHRIADVKVGTFLSGGVDSSYITAVQMPDETFSVGFAADGEENNSTIFNETNEAGELSKLLGVKNYRKLITADECFDALPSIQYHMDEPQANPSSVPLWFLAKLASEHVTVVLSGEGADEIFAGYEWYDDTPFQRKYKKLPATLRRFAAKAVRKLPYFKGHDMIVRSSGRPEDYFVGQAMVFEKWEAESVLSLKYRNGKDVSEMTGPIYARVADKTELEKKQYLDLNMWLPGDILLKADKMSMAHSLELRVPYLDREVMKFAQNIPAEYKINGIDTKYVFRRAANRTLPNEWANRHKLGFPVPIRYWLASEKYSAIVRKYFNAPFAAEFFDVAVLNRLLDDHVAGKVNNGRKIWVLFVFLTWYKRFFIDEATKSGI